MTALVVDASIAAGWLFDDEDDPRAARALALLAEVDAVVPRLWHYEMRNILLVAQRRGRITPTGFRSRLASLPDLPLRIDPEPDLDAAVTLAERHGLSFYDALYLELAHRLHATLASLDTALCRAATAENVPVLRG